MNPEEILYILINLYANNIIARIVAEKVGFSRNTINKYKKKFSYIKDDVIEFIQNNPELKNTSPSQLKDTFAARKFIKEHNIKSHLRITNYAIECEIKEICETYLNCYIFKKSPYDFACKQLKYYAKKLYKKHWENMDNEYYPDDTKEDLCKFPNFPNQNKGTVCFFEKDRDFYRLHFENYKRDVSNYHYFLRESHPVPRNYDEAYEQFKLKYDNQPPIGYGAFYNIARQYWVEDELVYNLFEDLNYVNSDDEKKK